MATGDLAEQFPGSASAESQIGIDEERLGGEELEIPRMELFEALLQKEAEVRGGSFKRVSCVAVYPERHTAWWFAVGNNMVKNRLF